MVIILSSNLYLIFFREFCDIDVQVQLHKMSTVLICNSHNQNFKLKRKCEQFALQKPASLSQFKQAHLLFTFNSSSPKSD